MDVATARVHVVLNAGAGAHDGAAARATIESVLRAAGRDHVVEMAEAGQLPAVAAAAVAAAPPGGSIVVAAGGDGTINAVARAVHGSACAFGVLPLGTFNYFARVHGLPADLEAATRVLVDGRLAPVQVGLLNDRLFLVNASLGLYPTLLEDREAFKAQFGRSRLVALAAALKTLGRGGDALRLVVDADGQPERVLRTTTLFVGNNRLQLEQIGLAEAGAVERGRLVAIVLRPVGMLEMLWLLARGAVGSLGDADSVSHYASTGLTVAPVRRRQRPIKAATDGEVCWLQAPLRFGVAPEPLQLVVPRQAAAGTEP